MDVAEHSDALALHNDEAYQNMLKEVTNSALLWKRFLDLPLPTGFTANSAWEAAHIVNYGCGIHLPPFTTKETVLYRYTIPVGTCITDIYSAILKNTITRKLNDSIDQQALMTIRIDNVIAAAKADGLCFDEQNVVTMLRYGQTPKTAIEQLIMNTFRAGENVAQYANEPFSKEMLISITESILTGVNPADISRSTTERIYLVPDFDKRINLSDTYDERRALNLLVEYLQGNIGDSFDLPILRGLLVSDLLRTFIPLHGFSSLLGQLLQHLCLRKIHLPILDILPLARIRLDWEEGKIGKSDVFCTKQEFLETQARQRGFGIYDITALQTVMVQLTYIELLRTINVAKESIERDESIKNTLTQNARFNYRQRSVLARASKGPEKQFTIRYHQVNHNVSYATARRDFEELVNSGYLSFTMQGKTQVFRASEQFDDLFKLKVHRT